MQPIPAIVEAFQSHNVVALGDAHGNEQAQAFLKTLVRDPRFAAVANDIVVEFGNARYQDVVDRFVRGDSVPQESLRMIWQNTTIANEIPVDEEFFRVVRTVNASFLTSKAARLLGDPPSTDHVKPRGHFTWLHARHLSAALIQVKCLRKQRRALLSRAIALSRKNMMSTWDAYWRSRPSRLLEGSTLRISYDLEFRRQLVVLPPDVHRGAHRVSRSFAEPHSVRPT